MNLTQRGQAEQINASAARTILSGTIVMLAASERVKLSGPTPLTLELQTLAN